MAPLFNLLAIVALGSSKVLATPTAALLGDLLHPDPTTDVPPTYPTTTTTPPACDVTITVTETETTTIPTTTTVTTTATVTAPCVPTLKCDKYGYLVQNVTLYRVDLARGTFTTVADHIGDNTPVNAIAYHPLDNFLYARQAGSNALIRIGSDGRVENVGTFPADASTQGVNVGDIDGEGYYWYGWSGTTWNQMDLRPGSATWGSTLASGTVDDLGFVIADWTYLPSGGAYLYTAAVIPTGGTALIRFSLDSKTWQVVQRYTRVVSRGWGASYGIDNGTLYASDNTNGQIWGFPIRGGAAFMASQGPPSKLNDGARCARNLNI